MKEARLPGTRSPRVTPLAFFDRVQRVPTDHLPRIIKRLADDAVGTVS